GLDRLVAGGPGQPIERVEVQPDGGERVADVVRPLGGGRRRGVEGGADESEVRHRGLPLGGDATAAPDEVKSPRNQGWSPISIGSGFHRGPLSGTGLIHSSLLSRAV